VLLSAGQREQFLESHDYDYALATGEANRYRVNLMFHKLGAAGALSRAGFCEATPNARVATTPARHMLESGRHIDWAFVRGSIQAHKGKVHNSVKASDHYPISFELRISD